MDLQIPDKTQRVIMAKSCSLTDLKNVPQSSKYCSWDGWYCCACTPAKMSQYLR